MLTRPLTDHPVHWRADQSTWDGYRDAGGVAPLELHALFDAPGRPARRLAAHPLLHGPRRGGRPLRRQGRAACVATRCSARYARVRRAAAAGARPATRYALLVSEVMLQQTQAARVRAALTAFLARFPTAAALAAAPLRDVLEEWSGLGYNRRALALARGGAARRRRTAGRRTAARSCPASDAASAAASHLVAGRCRRASGRRRRGRAAGALGRARAAPAAAPSPRAGRRRSRRRPTQAEHGARRRSCSAPSAAPPRWRASRRVPGA